MTAVTDLTSIYTILKGSAPTNPQMLRVTTSVTKPGGKFHQYVQGQTNEQLAQAVLDGIKAIFVDSVKADARTATLAPIIAQAHLPANQPALITAAAADIATAESTAAGDLG